MMRQAKHYLHKNSLFSHSLCKHGRRSAMLLTTAIVVSLPLAAHAYVGPGAGLSLLSALWGIIAAIAVAVLFVILWPIRRMRRQRKARHADELTAARTESDSHSESVEAPRTESSTPPPRS